VVLGVLRVLVVRSTWNVARRPRASTAGCVNRCALSNHPRLLIGFFMGAKGDNRQRATFIHSTHPKKKNPRSPLGRAAAPRGIESILTIALRVIPCPIRRVANCSAGAHAKQGQQERLARKFTPPLIQHGSVFRQQRNDYHLVGRLATHALTIGQGSVAASRSTTRPRTPSTFSTPSSTSTASRTSDGTKPLVLLVPLVWLVPIVSLVRIGPDHQIGVRQRTHVSEIFRSKCSPLRALPKSASHFVLM
jgi:hypothetical protein